MQRAVQVLALISLCEVTWWHQGRSYMKAIKLSQGVNKNLGILLTLTSLGLITPRDNLMGFM